MKTQKKTWRREEKLYSTSGVKKTPTLQLLTLYSHVTYCHVSRDQVLDQASHIFCCVPINWELHEKTFVEKPRNQVTRSLWLYSYILVHMHQV